MRSNFIDKAVTYFSPKNGLRRLQNRALMEKLESYNGASTSRNALKSWTSPKGDSDTDDLPDIPQLRIRSRDQYRNAPIVKGAIDTKAYNTVGAGLRLQSRINADYLGMSPEEARVWEKNTEFEFRIWSESKNCDAERTKNFYELQSVAFISTMLSGDVFALLPYIDRQSLYSLTVQLIEADRVSNPREGQDTSRIAGGVEVDEYTAPVAYHINKSHPNGLSNIQEWVRVDAWGAKTGRQNVIHLFEATRPNQRRGVPILAPVMENLKQLTDYTNAELMAALVSGMFTVFVKSESGSLPAPMGGDGEEEADYNLGSGAIVGLSPNESIETADPGRPNVNFDPFVMAIMKQIGSALQVPYELLIKHFSSSYSASRAALLEAWKAFKTRRTWFAANFCQPIYEEWLYEAILTGRIQANGFIEDEAIRKAYCNAEWNGPTAGQLDPLKETQAAEARVQSGFSTRSKEASEMNGTDFAQNAKMAIKEGELMREAGLGLENVTDGEADSKETDDEETKPKDKEDE